MGEATHTHSRRATALILMLIGAGGAPSVLLAQPADDSPEESGSDSGGSGLASARAAYAAVDFAGTIEAANASLAHGGHGVAETAELYRLLGLSLAALQRNAEARDAFIRLIAIDPEVRLERALSPALRSPYLEARGYWSQYGDSGLSIEVTMDGSRLRIDIRDPAGLGANLRVWQRSEPGDDFIRVEDSVSEEVVFDVGQERAEVVVQVLDAQNNVLVAYGAERAPERVGDWSITPEAVPAPPPAFDRTTYHITAVIMAGLAAVSAGVAVPFHLARERLAEVWNDAPEDECDDNGTTRAEVCAGVNSDRETAEVLAVVLYSGAGAFAVAALSVLLVGELQSADSTEEQAWSCGGGPGEVGVSCGLRF